MDFIDFVKSAIESEKKVTMKSISETGKSIFDGDTEFQINFPNALNRKLKNREQEKLNRKNIVTYTVYSGFDIIDTGYKIIKIKDKNIYYIVFEDEKGNLSFTDYFFYMEESKVTFVNQPPNENDRKLITKSFKASKRKSTILYLILPFLLGVLIYLLFVMSQTITSCGTISCG